MSDIRKSLKSVHFLKHMYSKSEPFQEIYNEISIFDERVIIQKVLYLKKKKRLSSSHTMFWIFKY